MNFMSPPLFDILNIQIWKVKMSLYVKALGIHVYFATTKDSYCLNGKNIEANAKALVGRRLKYQTVLIIIIE